MLDNTDTMHLEQYALREKERKKYRQDTKAADQVTNWLNMKIRTDQGINSDLQNKSKIKKLKTWLKRKKGKRRDNH